MKKTKIVIQDKVTLVQIKKNIKMIDSKNLKMVLRFTELLLDKWPYDEESSKGNLFANL